MWAFAKTPTLLAPVFREEAEGDDDVDDEDAGDDDDDDDDAEGYAQVNEVNDFRR